MRCFRAIIIGTDVDLTRLQRVLNRQVSDVFSFVTP